MKIKEPILKNSKTFTGCVEISHQLPTFRTVVRGQHETVRPWQAQNGLRQLADLSQPKAEARFSEQPSTNAMHDMIPELRFHL